MGHTRVKIANAIIPNLFLGHFRKPYSRRETGRRRSYSKTMDLHNDALLPLSNVSLTERMQIMTFFYGAYNWYA